MNSLTLLLTMHILRYMPTQHLALVCSAGSQGYHALKEMLQSGVPGNTLLIESRDLREVGVPNTDPSTELAPHVDGEESEDARERSGSYVEEEYSSDIDSREVSTYGGADVSLERYWLGTFMDSDVIPDYTGTVGDCTHLDVYTNMATVPCGFLTRCTETTTINLTPLTSATVALKSFFLERCFSLESIDLSSLSQVKEIHGYFMHNCVSLTSIDLSPLSQVTTIHDGFLGCCESLESIDLSPLSSLAEIGDSFLEDCTGLNTIDLSPLSWMVVIPYAFLRGCSGLTSIDLSPLSQVTTIHDGFLGCCESLESIDLSPLSSLAEIGDSFLEDCTGLNTIDLSPLSWMVVIPYAFLRGCSGLTSIDLSPLSQVTTPSVPSRVPSSLVVSRWSQSISVLYRLSLILRTPFY